MTSLATISQVTDPGRLLQRVAQRTLELVPHSDGVLVGLADAGGICYVSSSGRLIGFEGTTVDFDRSLSGLAAKTKEVLYTGNSQLDARTDAAICKQLNVMSSVCVPLIRHDEILGVLAVSSSELDAFDECDVKLLRRVAEFVSLAVGLAGDLSRVTSELFGLRGSLSEDLAEGTQISHDTAERFVRGILEPGSEIIQDARDRVQAILNDPRRLSLVFQPIVDLVSEEIVSVEALSRFSSTPMKPPDQWFAEAEVSGLGLQLELMAVKAALGERSQLSDGVKMAINVGPSTIMSEQFQELIADLDDASFIVELTEHARVDNYEALMAAVNMMRKGGIRLSIDDTGAGFSGLSHILRVAPDFIKLDRDLVHGIDIDPVRRALASSLVTFANETGASIIAEGIETASELEAVRRLGIRFGQGFHIGRPAPIAKLPTYLTL